MMKPPKPDRSGNIKFQEKKGKGAGNQIESFPIAQTIHKLQKQLLDKYKSEIEKANAVYKFTSADFKGRANKK